MKPDIKSRLRRLRANAAFKEQRADILINEARGLRDAADCIEREERALNNNAGLASVLT